MKTLKSKLADQTYLFQVRMLLKYLDDLLRVLAKPTLGSPTCW